MSKGVIYCMNTIVQGLVKIGRTGSDSFESRMYHLEHNGYCNVVGLKREFAIEVDDYEEKEHLIHDIFSKSRVGDTELFAVDLELVIQLLSSLDGTQIYPKDISKEEVFEKATFTRDIECIPDGEYYFETKPKHQEKVYKAFMKKENGKLILSKGSELVDRNNVSAEKNRIIKERAKIENDVLMEDIECETPSMAAVLVSGTHLDGWKEWKTKDGRAIDIFRNKKEDGSDE